MLCALAAGNQNNNGITNAAPPADFFRQHFDAAQKTLHAFSGKIHDILGLDEAWLPGEQRAKNTLPLCQGFIYMIPAGIIHELGWENSPLSQQIFICFSAFSLHGVDDIFHPGRFADKHRRLGRQVVYNGGNIAVKERQEMFNTAKISIKPFYSLVEFLTELPPWPGVTQLFKFTGQFTVFFFQRQSGAFPEMISDNQLSGRE